MLAFLKQFTCPGYNSGIFKEALLGSEVYFFFRKRKIHRFNTPLRNPPKTPHIQISENILANSYFEIPRTALPATAREGDLLLIHTQSSSSSEAEARLQRLKERDDGEDIIDL